MEEGLELNLLGLVIGVDPKGLAIKLPGVGRGSAPAEREWPRAMRRADTDGWQAKPR